MPKRSLNQGKNEPRKNEQTKIEQLNRAIDVMLARADGKPSKVEASLEPLVRVAGDLRDLPRENFKSRLKNNLERSSFMASTAELMTAIRTFAAPRISFKNAAKAIEFYEKAFGAKESWRFEHGGRIGHAEIMIGDTVVMLCEEWPEGGRFSAETWGHSSVSMTIQVPDVDAAVERAVAAGATVTIPSKDQFYGHRDATVTDPFGYAWNLYTVKEEMSVEEMHRRFQNLMKGPQGGEISAKKAAVDPIRKGFRTVTPYLIAKDGPALLEFAKQAFGAVETLRAIGPAGGLHGEVRIGDSLLMIGGGIPGKEFRATPNMHALHMYVEDADAVYQKALAAGATVVDEPRDQDYGERSAGVKDPAGNFWYIARHKGESYLPKGLHNVNPYLHPRRAEPLISFLKRAFGAQEVAKYVSPDGVVNHAEIRVGDSIVEMGEAHGKYETMPAMFYVSVTNVDDVYRQALAAGGTSVQEPTDQPYGDRNAGVKDTFGNTWFIATHIRDVAH